MRLERADRNVGQVLGKHFWLFGFPPLGFFSLFSPGEAESGRWDGMA